MVGGDNLVGVNGDVAEYGFRKNVRVIRRFVAGVGEGKEVPS